MESNTTDRTARFGSEFPYSDTTRCILIMILILLILLGVIGNALVVVVFLKVKFLRTRLNMFILNLAVIDFLIMSYQFPFSIAAFINKGYPMSKSWCAINHGIVRFLLSAECLNITMIATSRYLKVCQQKYYDKFLTKNSILIICLVCPWVFGLLVSIKVFSDHTIMKFIPAWQMCYVDSSKSAETKWVFFIFLAIQYPVTFQLYYNITKKVRAVQKNVDSNRSSSNMFKRLNLASTRGQIMSCFVIFLLYVVLQFPALIQVVFFPDAPVALQFTFMCMIGLNCSINCVIYGLLNKNVIRSYRQILPTVWFVQNRERIVERVER